MMERRGPALKHRTDASGHQPRPPRSVALYLMGVAILLAGLVVFVAPVVTMDMTMGGFMMYAIIGMLLFSAGGVLIMVGLIARARSHSLPLATREDALRRSARGLVLQGTVAPELGTYGPPRGDGSPGPTDDARARADRAIKEARRISADVSEAELLFEKASSVAAKHEGEVARELFEDASASAEQAQTERVRQLLNDAKAMLARAGSQGIDVSEGMRMLGEAEEALTRRDLPETFGLLNRGISTAFTSEMARSQAGPSSGTSGEISIIDAGDHLELRTRTGTDDWQSVRWRVVGSQFVVETTTEQIARGHREDAARTYVSSSRTSSTLETSLPVPVDVTRASVDLSDGWLTVRLPKA